MSVFYNFFLDFVLLFSVSFLKSEIFLGLLKLFFLGFSVSLLNSEMIENSEIFLSFLQFYFLSFSASLLNSAILLKIFPIQFFSDQLVLNLEFVGFLYLDF
ncbi:MAG: hypothetical protein APF83_12320 [Lutibacter sp. BRH_c52]|nr:MAG: hypothetical protein APF83_12320 [Lutibacter sp. BRH_c52]